MARTLEEAGIVTVTLSMFHEMAKQVKAPRTLLVDNPYGGPYGQPFDDKGHREILIKALAMAKQLGIIDQALMDKI